MSLFDCCCTTTTAAAADAAVTPILLNRRQPVRAPVRHLTTGPELAAQNLESLFVQNKFARKKEPLPSVIQTSLPPRTTADATAPPPLFATNQGFVGIASAAYNQHHALVLRPDDVWQALVIQFSFYVQARAEALRDRLVDFQGKKELVVNSAGTLYSAAYGDMAERMVGQIQQNIRDPTVADWLLPAFTTTTANDRVVASISIMATLQAYFDYKFHLECGIPSVQLLGTVADWELLQSKLDRFLEFAVPATAGDDCMAQWVDSLRPILAEMLATRRGVDNMDSFWERILTNSGGGSGPRYISGWIRAFCAFTDKGVYQGNKDRINTNDIPIGVLSVPVTVDDNGNEHKCTLVAGQMGADVVLMGAGLQPRSDWMIVLGQTPSVAGWTDTDDDGDY